MKATATKKSNGKIDVHMDMTCDQCGGKITQITTYGCFCDKGCGRKEAENQMMNIMTLFEGFGKAMGDDRANGLVEFAKQQIEKEQTKG